jgi:uncharacterized protein (TIGR02145 family)
MDARDGKEYKWIKINSFIWMAENLNYDPNNNASSADGYRYYCYENKVSNCDIFGLLYNYQTAMIACPVGWHLPSVEK